MGIPSPQSRSRGSHHTAAHSIVHLSHILFSCARLLQEGEDQLLDYEEEEANQEDKGAAAAEAGEAKKGHYVGVHSSGFRDFMLKPELQRAVVDCGCVPRWRVCGWVAAPMIPFLPLPPCQTHPILPTSPPASESHV